MRVFSNFDKARNVMFLWYPESGGEYGDLLASLDELHMPCACSPLHDADTFTTLDVKKWVDAHTDKQTGEIAKEAIEAGLPVEGAKKKPHVHVIITANGPMTAEWFAKKLQENGIQGVTYFEAVNSVSSMLRYFAHLDSPDKHPYNPLDVHGFGGLDLSPLLKTSKVVNLQVLIEVLEYIRTNNVRHYHKLVGWALERHDLDILACVTGRASFFASYFRSRDDELRELDKKEKEAERASRE